MSRGMRIQIDRDLPVPVATQVQGQIEYGVSNGDFPPGSRLPSVRELAAELGVSPVTVSQVYKALGAKRLITAVPGRGTFVRDAASAPVERRSSRVDELLSLALRAAEREGVRSGELVARFQRLLGRGRGAQVIRAVFVGVYREVTRAYVADLRRHLRPDDRLDAVTFDDLAVGAGGSLAGAHAVADDGLAGTAAARAALERADLVLTFAYRVQELRSLLRQGSEVATVNLIPSERTRVALAELDPLASVVLVSTVPEFLSAFRRSVARFACQVESVRAVLWGTAEAEAAVVGADVVVYGTGSERVLDGMPGHVRTFEFRHVPDPIHVERVLLPLIDRIRTGLAGHDADQEAP